MALRTRRTRFVLSLHHTPGEPSRSVFYSVVRAGHLIAGPEHRIERDTYPGHELILCLRGGGFVRVAGREHPVRPGDLVWVNCYHPHAYRADSRSPWELYWIRVEGPGLDRIAGLLSADRLPVVTGAGRSEMKGLFERIFRRLQGGRPDAPAFISAKVARLVALLFSARLKLGDVARTEAVLPPALARPVQTMRLYFHRPLRVAELAALAGMSESSFMRWFKQVMGTSPIDWLRRERITQAKRRLSETNDSIKEIAGQVGYSDQFFFSKDFKKCTGSTPTDFRRREQGRL